MWFPDMAKIFWTKTAAGDLIKARDYISKGRLYRPHDALTRIEGTLDAVTREPSLGKPMRVKSIREVRVLKTPFIIAYREMPEGVEVLSLIHKSKMWE